MSCEVNLPNPEACLKKLKNTFPHLTEAELQILLTTDAIRAYKKGELLYEEGTRIKGCYFIYCGIIKIYQTGHGERTNHKIRPGRRHLRFSFCHQT